jgi:hypothetical protein
LFFHYKYCALRVLYLYVFKNVTILPFLEVGPQPRNQKWFFISAMDGWLKIHRQILFSQQYSDPNDFKLWVWMLCKASIKDRHITIKTSKGSYSVNLKRGQFVFGRNKAEEETQINSSSIYRAVQRFVTDGCISVESNNHFSIITVTKYCDYQESIDFEDFTIIEERTAIEQPLNIDRTADEQQTNSRRTHNKKVENVEKVEKVKKVSKNHLFTESPYFDLAAFKMQFLGIEKYEAADLEQYHEAMLLWSASKGEKKADWVATAKNWINRDISDKKLKVKNNGTVKQPFANSSAARDAGGRTILRSQIESTNADFNAGRNGSL